MSTTSTTGSASRWTRGRIIGIIAVFVVVILGIAALFVFQPWNSNGADQTPTIAMTETPAPGETQEPPQEEPPVNLEVTANDLIPPGARCHGDEFSWNSMPNTLLYYGDSVTVPFVSDEIPGMLKEILAENCNNWTFLDMNIRGYYDLPYDATHTIGELNGWWMDPYLEQLENGNTCVIKKEGEGDKLFVAAACQQYAEYMNTIILRLKPTGLYDVMSLANWHVPPREGLAVGTLPRAVLNTETEEDLRALHLTYTIKDAVCGIYELEVAYDIFDKRLKVIRITPVDCTVTPPTGGCTAGTCDTVVKTCASEYPNYPYGTYPVCKDGAGHDPSYNGNNLQGGNGQGPQQGDGVGAPAGGTPGSTYTAPATPTPGLPVGSTPVEEPALPKPPAEGGDGLN
jgi:hypothetical protein